MKFKLMTSIGLVLAASVPSAFAADADSAAMEKSIKQITAQTQALQAEIKNLKAQLTALKQQQQNSSTATYQPIQKKTVLKSGSDTNTAQGAEVPVTLPQSQANQPGFYERGITITTSPFLSYRSNYDASDVIVNMASMNQDLGFLQLLQKVAVQNAPQYQTYVDRPLLAFSGKIEGLASWHSPFGSANDSNDYNLSSAEIDLFAKISPWALGYFSLNYDNSPFNVRSRGVSPSATVSNSRVFLKRGFITLGDLNQIPFYMTVGQFYMPFGYFSSNMVSTPETQILGRTNTRGVLVGYNQYGLNVSAYTFNGDSKLGQGGINQMGANISYHFQPVSNISINLGAGYISNMSDAEGIQNTGVSSGFLGFSQEPAFGLPKAFDSELLARRVPGMDLNGKISFGSSFALIAEYISATRQYGLNSVTNSQNVAVPVYDVSFNGHGARPSAFHLEGQYYFEMFGKPSNINLAYGHSSEALGINLPRNSYTIALNTSLWKNTILGVEYRHDIDYSSTSYANGLSTADDDGSLAPNFYTYGTGSSQDTVLVQLGIYF